MVFGRKEDLNKYRKHVAREYVIKTMSIRPLIALVILSIISVLAAVRCVSDYGVFTREAQIAEFVSFAFCCFTCAWFSAGVIRYKKAEGILKLFIINMFSLLAVITVMLLNESYMYVRHIPFLSFDIFIRSMFSNILMTDGILWARYPCVFLSTVFAGFYISTGSFGKLYMRMLKSRFFMNRKGRITKLTARVKQWLIDTFSVTDAYDIVEAEQGNIFVTGDIHGVPERLTGYNKLRTENIIRKEDYLVVCGDFGFLFEDDEKEKEFLDYIEASADYTILFVDGNHENFNAINSYPVEDWKSGKIHRIRKNIIHLMRGQVYDICGLKVFAMGGAYSVDRSRRQKDKTYWAEELPSDEDYRTASENLERCNKNVDIILTHTAPEEIIYLLGHTPDRHDAELTGFLEWVLKEVSFKKWYFGHWHTDARMVKGCRALYNDLVKVNREYEAVLKEEMIDVGNSDS